MKKHLGLIVLAGSIAFASLAVAQVPVPPAAPAAPAPVAVPNAATAPPPAPPSPMAAPAVAPPSAPTPVAAPAPPPAPAPMAAAVPQPPQTPPPAKAPKPPRAPEASKPPEPAKAGDPTAPLLITPAPEPPQPPPPGRERAEPDPVNIQFQVTVTAQSGSNPPAKRTAILTVSNGTGSSLPRGMLRAGNNIPVASTSLMSRSEDGKETPAAKPLTSYNYKSVGLNVDVEQATVVAGNRVRAALSVEFSGVDEKTGPGVVGTPPSFPTFSQRISLYFDSGKPVLVAQSSDQTTGMSQTIEVKATILR